MSANTIERIENASKLQTDYKQVLEWAAEQPVVIQRRGGQPAITMINRTVWHEAVTARAWLTVLSGVVNYAVARFLDEPKPICPAEFSWLRLYDKDDVREFVGELSGAIGSAVQHTGKWETVDAVVSEWCRSASLLENREMMDRFKKAQKGM